MDVKRRVVILRLGHRPLRDKRMTSHVGLVARAFGANGLILTVADKALVESLKDVSERWGGDFFVKVVSNWRLYMKRWKGLIVHLTMYGVPVDEVIDEIRDVESDVLVIVGAEKVPPDVYRRARYNIAVGSQPHSEVAALAVFLDRYFKGRQLGKKFRGKMRVIPSSDGKKVVVE